MIGSCCGWADGSSSRPAPGSKSISHRALNLALIGQQPATIENLLEADDIAAFRAALVAMGWRVRSVAGSGLRLEPGPEADSQRPVRLDCRSAGTLLRLLVATCAVIPGQWILDGSPRLRERPIGPLVAALRQLGAGIEELGRPGCAPVRIRGGRLAGGRVEIEAGESSQYVSALLMAALNAEGSIELLAPVLVSSPYVDTTLEVMADF
ncbi:MAG: 3-phosphoshikimate 1-carboxyvinyltransferase, partial [Acidobacteriota bacterium]|nr:3-phosphoshikimate 1-carboxyvinyltransferase [Acidobacteriota bacterium]